MKKLNSKGFTLVELLAVIIILAIVVGITVPSILNTTNTAKERAFQTAADTSADWFERQYSSYNVGDDDLSPVDSNFTETVVTGAKSGTGITISNALAEASGLKSKNIVTSANGDANIHKSTLYIDANNRVCVKLVSNASGDYATGIRCGGVCTDAQCKESNSITITNTTTE